MIQIHDKSFEVYLDNQKLQERIAEMGRQLSEEYAGKELIFVAVLNGAFMFAADLLKHIAVPCEISFIKVQSYQGMHSTGRVDEVIGLTNPLAGKHIVILEDIVDTGITMNKLFTLLGEEKPESLKIATLLFKPEPFEGQHAPDYVGFEIPNAFVVGYGLDYNEHGRNHAHIYQLKEN